MEEDKRSLDSFLQWASERGVSDVPLNPKQPPPPPSPPSSRGCLGHFLSIGYFPKAGGRGLTANRNLRRGELVLTVPHAALMTSESILEKDAKLSHAVKGHPSLSPTQVLTILLLAEIGKGRKSFWYPYLMQLPRSYDILATFRPFELKALQVDEAIWTAEKSISKAESDWKEAIALIGELKLKPELVTFKAWLWASATISSRTLHIPWDTAGCLCPVGDFFNYAAPGDDFSTDVASFTDACSIGVSSLEDGYNEEAFTPKTDQCEGVSGRLTDGSYDESFAAYCFYAKKNYQKGEQVLLSYGTYTNLELLEHYGFLLSHNPNDKVFIPLTDEILAANSWPGDSMYIQYDGNPSFALQLALRYWATPPVHRRSIQHLTFSGSLLSPENEMTVMRWIASECDAILRSLPTKIEDDHLLLLAIDRFHDDLNPGEVTKLPCVVADQLYDFIASVGLRDGETGNKVAIPDQKKCAARSLDKWKLAITWRVRYKKVLIDAISHCTRTVEFLSRNR